MTRVLDVAAAIVGASLVFLLTVMPSPPRAFFVVAAVLTAASLFCAARSWVMAIVVVEAAALVSTFILRQFGRCPTIIGGGADLQLFVFVLSCLIGTFVRQVRTAAAAVAAGAAVAFFYPLSDTLVMTGSLHPLLPLLAAVVAVGLEAVVAQLRNRTVSFAVTALAPTIALLPSSLLLMFARDTATSALPTTYVLPGLAVPATIAALLVATLARALPSPS